MNKGGTPENLRPYKKGESGNPNGRPKKVLSLVLSELREEGYERVSPSQVQEAYEIVLGLDFERLIAVSTDEDLPSLLNIVARHLQSKDKAFQVLEQMLDRAHGKATQKVEQEVKQEVKLPKINWLDE